MYRTGYTLERMVQEIHETAVRDRKSSQLTREESETTPNNGIETFRPGRVHLLRDKFAQLSRQTQSNRDSPAACSSVSVSRPLSCSASPATPRRSQRSLPPSHMKTSSSWDLSSRGNESAGNINSKFSFPVEQQSLRNASSESFLDRVGAFETRCNDINGLQIKNIVSSTRSLFENISNASLPRPPVTHKKTVITENTSSSLPLPVPRTLRKKNSFTSSTSIQFAKPCIPTSLPEKRTVQVIRSQAGSESPTVPPRKNRVNNNYLDQAMSFPPIPSVRKTAPAVVEVRPYTPEVSVKDAGVVDDLTISKPKTFVDEGRRAIHKSIPWNGRSWLFTKDDTFNNVGNSIQVLLCSFPKTKTMSMEMAAQRTFWDSYREEKTPDVLDSDIVLEAKLLISQGSKTTDLDEDSVENESLEDVDRDHCLEQEDEYNLKSCLRDPFKRKNKMRLQFAQGNQLETFFRYQSEASFTAEQQENYLLSPSSDMEADSLDGSSSEGEEFDDSLSSDVKVDKAKKSITGHKLSSHLVAKSSGDSPFTWDQQPNHILKPDWRLVQTGNTTTPGPDHSVYTGHGSSWSASMRGEMDILF